MGRPIYSSDASVSATPCPTALLRVSSPLNPSLCRCQRRPRAPLLPASGTSRPRPLPSSIGATSASLLTGYLSRAYLVHAAFPFSSQTLALASASTQHPIPRATPRREGNNWGQGSHGHQHDEVVAVEEGKKKNKSLPSAAAPTPPPLEGAVDPKACPQLPGTLTLAAAISSRLAAARPRHACPPASPQARRGPHPRPGFLSSIPKIAINSGILMSYIADLTLAGLPTPLSWRLRLERPLMRYVCAA